MLDVPRASPTGYNEVSDFLTLCGSESSDSASSSSCELDRSTTLPFLDQDAYTSASSASSLFASSTAVADSLSEPEEQCTPSGGTDDRAVGAVGVDCFGGSGGVGGEPTHQSTHANALEERERERSAANTEPEKSKSEGKHSENSEDSKDSENEGEFTSRSRAPPLLVVGANARRLSPMPLSGKASAARKRDPPALVLTPISSAKKSTSADASAHGKKKGMWSLS
jgi:hypothetical protein